MGRQGNRHQPRGRRAVLEQGVKILFTLCGRIERSFRWRPAEQHEVDAALVDGCAGSVEVGGGQNTIAVEDAVAVAMVGRADDPVPCAVQQLGAYVHEGQHGLRLAAPRSEEHTSELQSLMRISYAVFCLQK